MLTAALNMHYTLSGACPKTAGLSLLCCVPTLLQERVSSIHPEDLMQIISHMDSRDKHRVRGCSLRVGLAHLSRVGGRPTHHA